MMYSTGRYRTDLADTADFVTDIIRLVLIRVKIYWVYCCKFFAGIMSFNMSTLCSKGCFIPILDMILDTNLKIKLKTRQKIKH